MSCGVGRGRGSDLVLLWLWHRLAGTALMKPLAWEAPYAAGAAFKKTKDKKKKKKKKEEEAEGGGGDRFKPRQGWQVRRERTLIPKPTSFPVWGPVLACWPLEMLGKAPLYSLLTLGTCHHCRAWGQGVRVRDQETSALFSHTLPLWLREANLGRMLRGTSLITGGAP